MSEPQLDENGYQIVPCKIVLVGQSGVGKTNIITKYVNNEFSEDTESTNGASFASKEIVYDKLKKTLKMEIWDTAGQEKFRSLTRFFYKDAAIAILVYDITRKDSFEELKSYWIGQINQFANKNIKLGIAGNKSDLYFKEEVSEDEARLYSNQINAIFRLTSALNGSGIKELFYAIGNAYLDPEFQDILEKEKQEDIKDGTTQNTIKLDKSDNNKEENNSGNNKEKKKKKMC